MLRRLMDALRRLTSSVRLYVDILNAREIARRMFVTNSFDGLLSSLGIILGNYVYGTTNPESYVAGVVGASFTLGFFSGIVATYLSERAERLRELRRTERVMLHSLRGSVYEKAAKVVPLYVAVWSGLGAILLPVIGVSPFIAAVALGFKASLPVLAYMSAGIILAELFALGAYLGRISGENMLVSGARMASIGLAAVLLFTFIGAI